MARPLIISDCDEVLLHMVVPFSQWLDEAHDIHFDVENGSFLDAIRHKHDGTLVYSDRVWELLGSFFDTEMPRQYPCEGAVEAIGRLSQHADIAILTNLLDHRGEARAEQLSAVGINAPIHTNQGGKGRKIAGIIADYAPSMTFFVDDLAQHHYSALEHAPPSWRIHMIGEPLVAQAVKPAPAAHARIDRWAEAEAWIMERIESGAEPTPMDISQFEEPQYDH